MGHITVITQFMENLYSYPNTSSYCVHLNMSKELEMKKHYGCAS